ncbi:MAG: amino acid permease [Candidatus Kerfeldbacteria bacterium]|nr:amino acid permease [Candidatus Kerfeldbacteria bacterium]
MVYNKKFFFALATFIGTIVGVGIYGLPYVGAQAGFLLLVSFLLLAAIIVFVVNRMLASIAVHTPGLHQLPGYAQTYLGPWAKRAALVIKVLSFYGTLLSYLIIGGQFLANLLSGPDILYTFIFFIVAALLIWRGARSIGPVELILMSLLILLVILLLVFGFSSIEATNLKPINWSYAFLPYGVALFAMWGASIIPELKEELAGDLKKLTRIIIVGLSTCLALYLVFSFLVIGISGPATSENAIAGLTSALGGDIVKFGYLLGVITTFSSFTTLGMTTHKLFWYDYKIPKFWSWLLAMFVPLTLFIIGLQDFIAIISITGAIMLGLDGILVALVFIAMKRKQGSSRLTAYSMLSAVLMVCLLIGVILEITKPS